MCIHAEPVILATGPVYVIQAACEANGTYPAQAFIDDDLDDQKRRSLNVLFRKLVDAGRINNREHFKKVEGDIWEFKRGQIRVGCFQDGRAWVLTHGFIKKSDNWPPGQLERAERIRAEHLQCQQNNKARKT